jgi:hypothetical protein
MQPVLRLMMRGQAALARGFRSGTGSTSD